MKKLSEDFTTSKTNSQKNQKEGNNMEPIDIKRPVLPKDDD